MMHKTSFVFLGAIAGAGLTLLATQPHTVFVESIAEAASSDTYRQLNLFGEVFERVRAYPTTASSSNRRSTAC